jgi:hypothetical protein
MLNLLRLYNVPLWLSLFLIVHCTAYAACISCVSHSGGNYTELVCEGDSTFDAIRKCGPPDYREETAEETTGEISSGPTWRPHTKTMNIQKRRVERFYYDCGSMRLIRILTFSGGRLISIEDGGRGSASEQRCW